MKSAIRIFTVLLTLNILVFGLSYYDIQTDKARYEPADTVWFRLNVNETLSTQTLTVKYYSLCECVDSAEVAASAGLTEWCWIASDKDFTGYLAEIQAGDQVLEIAVDVSSDWTRYPRYGFLSKFPLLTDSEIQSKISVLNRYHINGIQFYDWHWKHHMPVSGSVSSPSETWQDIANRTIYRETVEEYISEAHTYNMKAMAYNLLYGAYEDASSDGASDQWRTFYDTNHQNPIKHDLDDSWASDIYVMDHTNSTWQNYISYQMKKVFQAFEFDGWHVDQLGSITTNWYTYNGGKIEVAIGFQTFLEKMKNDLDVPLVMNAVDQFGQSNIAASPIEFHYTEVWSKTTFSGLVNVLQLNKYYNSEKQSVLAAYVNRHANLSYMNTPAVLLADAVIFANGGSHLELGEHMLNNEYFPNDDLKMSFELKERLVRYYDFMTAYESVLRGDFESISFAILSEDGLAFSKTLSQNSIWVKAFRNGNRDAIQFINFMNVATMNWNDTNGSQVFPTTQKDMSVVYRADSSVSAVYLCSPDFESIKMKPIGFEQTGNELRFTLDSLSIWDMVLVEYDFVSAIEDEHSACESFELLNNYPNPFNNSTVIKFELPKSGIVKLKVFDCTGRQVYEKTSYARQGINEFTLNANNLSTGLYFYKLQYNNTIQTRKMVLLK